MAIMRKRNHTTSEKPKEKRRRHRGHEEKLARFARDESNPEENTGPIKYFKGACEPTSCEAEAACMAYNSTVYFCKCTFTGMPITEHSHCPRSTVTATPQPIRNVIPPQPRTTNAIEGGNSQLPPTIQFSGEVISEATTGNEPEVVGAGIPASTGILLAALVGGALLLVLVVSLLVWYFRRRICRVDGKTQPRVRPGEPLLAERYITNPQYGVYGAGAAAAGSVPTNGPIVDDTTEPRVPLLDRSALTFLEEVGEGCFGKVHRGLLRVNDAEQEVAIKVLKESAGRSAEEEFIREVSIMSAFRHSNILTLVGVVYKDNVICSPWMVFEYMELGDLAGVLRGSRNGVRPVPTLNNEALLHVALQVARGMQYLASRRFVHRDLAARNCLVGSHLTVKIADFGMSRDVYTCDYYKMGGERPMPVRWMSPESILYARFTHESDVWAYGVVLWEIYSRGKQPFYGHNNEDATKLIVQGILLVPPEDCPRFACELMRECWQFDPQNRIDFDEICRKLEIASEGGGTTEQVRLPRPPNPSQDSAGYLIPARQTPVDYLTLLLGEEPHEPESDSSEDEDEEEYT